MARKKNQKKGKGIRFELSFKGLFGLGVVLFCIFLWMFLLGIWAGQKLLVSGAGEEYRAATPVHDISGEDPGDGATYLSRVSSILKKGSSSLGKKASEVKDKVMTRELWHGSSEDSIFSIQIASTDDQQEAGRLVMDWQAMGYDAFYRSPEESFPYRVFIGRFEEFGQAKAHADTLESSENVRVYITLLPTTEDKRDS